MTFLISLCVGLVGLLFAAAVCFGGYRLFFALLPIWGFVFGFGVGAQTVQAIFGGGFLATTTSWVVGLVLALVFAVLSYLYFTVAVAVLSASFGYAIGAGIMGALTPNWGFLNWLVGVVMAVVALGLVLRYRLYKPAIIAMTAIMGAGMMILVLLGESAQADGVQLVADPVRTAVTDSFWWLIFFIGVAAAGMYVQWQANRAHTIEQYNRMVIYTIE